MSKIKWLFEKDTQDDLMQGLIYACDELGYEYKLADIMPYSMKEQVASLYEDNEAVVVLGSIQLCKFITNRTNWTPGVYCTFDNYKCTNYYPRLSQFLLNDNYIMLPYGELKRRKDFLFSTLGQDRCVFVRPDVGTKLFTGEVCKQENFESKVDFFGFYETRPEDLVVVATPRNIIHEWRVLIVDGKVITGSMYRPDKKRDTPQAVFDYAQRVADVYQPDKCFVVDVGETSTGLYLIEVGSFSCAGMYMCDPKLVVQAVSEQAQKDYEDMYV